MKRACVISLLFAFTAWPWAQHVLVRTHEIHPRRFGGWAAHAVPHFEPTILLFAIEGGAGKALQAQTWSAPVREAAMAYVERRSAFGLFAGHPDDVGLALLQEFPKEGALVLIQRHRYDRESGRLVVDREQHLYRPNGEVTRGVRRDSGT